MQTAEEYLDPKQNWGAEAWRQPTHTENETVLFSECGRILDCDYRSHWFKVIKSQFGPEQLLVHHGGGEERFSLGYVTGRHLVFLLSTLESNQRYLLMHALFNLHKDGQKKGREETAYEYKNAFVDGRLKKRKVRGRDQVKVFIEPAYIKAKAEAEKQ